MPINVAKPLPIDKSLKMSIINRHLSHAQKTMKASIVDLRYKTSDILKALDNNESVTVLYHGKVKGIIKPVREKKEGSVKDHPFFGMHRDNNETVMDELKNLRKPRYDL